MKKLLIASDSFKGTLTSKDIISICQNVIQDYHGKIELSPFLIADGGEGSIDALQYVLKGRLISKTVLDANNKNIEASYLFYQETAIIEVAKVISLPHTQIKDPFITSSYGVGQLILDAISKGAKRIIVALGGSSTNDGGAPILQALGANFFDKEGKEIEDLSNQNLNRIDSINLSILNENIKGIHFEGICDVTNPLLGNNGATYIYSPQKGAKESDLPILEANLSHYADKLNEATKTDYRRLERSGAAGGIGFGLATELHATLKSGIDTILDMVSIDDAIKECDFILSGEGRLDSQSFQGKVIDGILKRVRKENKTLSLIVGSIQEGTQIPSGIDYLEVTNRNRTSMEEIQKHAKEDYQQAFISFLKEKGLI